MSTRKSEGKQVCRPVSRSFYSRKLYEISCFFSQRFFLFSEKSERFRCTSYAGHFRDSFCDAENFWSAARCTANLNSNPTKIVRDGVQMSPHKATQTTSVPPKRFQTRSLPPDHRCYDNFTYYNGRIFHGTIYVCY